MKRTTLTLAAITLACAILAPAPANAKPAKKKRKPQAERVEPAKSLVQELLTEALSGPDGEYAARAEYQAILDKFGDVRPYANIIHAEERHIEALEGLFAQHGLPVPKDRFAGKITAPETLREAAESGVEAEKKNVAMYDRLIAQARNHPDLVQVFTSLQWASREHHLPAFQRALGGGGRGQAGDGQQSGPGFGRGGGGGCGAGCSGGNGFRGGRGSR